MRGTHGPLPPYPSVRIATHSLWQHSAFIENRLFGVDGLKLNGSCFGTTRFTQKSEFLTVGLDLETAHGADAFILVYFFSVHGVRSLALSVWLRQMGGMIVYRLSAWFVASSLPVR